MDEARREKKQKIADLIQDSNTNATYAAMKKGGLMFSGGSLSKSENPFLKKASEKPVKKKKIWKASDTTKKVLSDISNSNRNKTSRKTKLNVTDEQFDLKDIAEEEFEHDHEACMKYQLRERAMDMDYVLKTLELPHGFPRELPWLEKHETPPSPPPLFEMMEVPILDQSSYYSRFESPEDDQLGDDWMDEIDFFNFDMIELLELTKLRDL